jgi:hypothetical protein
LGVVCFEFGQNTGYNNASQNCYHEKPPKIISYPEETQPKRTFTDHKAKEAVDGARVSLQYFQSSDKNVRVVSRNILEFFTLFQNFYVFIPRFLAEPLTMICGTLVGKHWALLIEISSFPANKFPVTNNSFPEAMGFKTDISFSLKSMHLYRNMLEMLL